MNVEKDELERELERRLERVQAPAGFAEEVVRRADVRSALGKVIAWPKPWTGLAIAASLLLAAGLTGEQVHQRRQREEADREFTTAMQLTGHALQQTRDQLSRAGVRLEPLAKDSIEQAQ